jgi:hypothetical protein
MANRWYIAWLTAAWLAGCAQPADTETELRALVQDAANAAEERQLSFFRDLLADSYADPRGNDRDRLLALLRGYFVAHPRIEASARVDDIVLGAGTARVVVHARFDGPGAGPSRLWPAGLGREPWRIELELVEQRGRWQLIGASWEHPRQSGM